MRTCETYVKYHALKTAYEALDQKEKVSKEKLAHISAVKIKDIELFSSLEEKLKIKSFHITDLEANLASARALLASTQEQLQVALSDVECKEALRKSMSEWNIVLAGCLKDSEDEFQKMKDMGWMRQDEWRWAFEDKQREIAELTNQ